MNRSSRKLQHQTEQQSAHDQEVRSEQKQTAREWATPEEMLREDIEQTPVPPGVGARLRDSIDKEPAPRKGWWQRLFG
jgi:hypothetical protein